MVGNVIGDAFGGAINSPVLAIEWLERHRDRARSCPRHADLAEQWLRRVHESSCAYLGVRELPSGQPSWVVATQGNSFPRSHLKSREGVC